MPFGSTITITINSIAKVLNRINGADPYSSEYLLRSPTEEYRFKIRHSHSDRKGLDALQRGVDRHNTEFTHTIFATATTKEVVRKAYAVYEVYGSDDISAMALDVKGYLDYISASGKTDDFLAWLS